MRRQGAKIAYPGSNGFSFEITRLPLVGAVLIELHDQGEHITTVVPTEARQLAADLLAAADEAEGTDQ